MGQSPSIPTAVQLIAITRSDVTKILNVILSVLERTTPGNSRDKLIKEVQMALTKIGTDFNALVARATADETLIAALQAQVTALQAAASAPETLSPEDQAAETAAETFLATAQPADTTGAETPPATVTVQVGSGS
jgi:hypothetical protein